MTGPDPNKIYPNENLKQIVYIKNVITRPNIIVGDYTYYDDINGAEKFEEHVTHHYEFLGDKLIIGKFCAIAKGIEFVMNGANHRKNERISCQMISFFIAKFYLRNGYKETGLFLSYLGVEYEVFCMGGDFEPQEFKNMMKDIRVDGFAPAYFNK